MSLPIFFEQPPFAVDQVAKTPALLSGLVDLTHHHRESCHVYRLIVDTIFAGPPPPGSLAELPWLPVRLFKRMDLISGPREAIIRKLVSSGTTGQAVSRIYLNAETASLQTKGLAKIAGDFIGRHRLPMVIIDQRSAIDNRTSLNARAAGTLGFSTFGRDHFHLLDEDMEPDWSGLDAYLTKHAGSPTLLFGLTFIVWQQFIEQARSVGLTFRFPPGSILVHGGGWKRLVDRQVSNSMFKTALAEMFDIRRVHNYYGMVEQVGSIYFECEHGYLHAPAFADVIIRDPVMLQPLPAEKVGLIQVFSLLPRSYPGHSLLTEDLGVVHGEDDCACGRYGKRFSVTGRLKNVEVRGCSDTRGATAP